MTNKQPTQEQIKEFWERCGFEDVFESETGSCYWKAPNGDAGVDLPPLNLDNLFKYAVANKKNTYMSFEREGNRLFCYGKWEDGYDKECGCPRYIHLESDVDIGDMEYQEACALALFRAIYKVIKNVSV